MSTSAFPSGPAEERHVSIPFGLIRLEGSLVVPKDSRAAVMFAHGSGSSRHSPRNRYVARVLNGGNLATLLVDLLTHDEEAVDAQTAQLFVRGATHLFVEPGTLDEVARLAREWLQQYLTADYGSHRLPRSV
jgi:hypothetical protein